MFGQAPRPMAPPKGTELQPTSRSGARDSKRAIRVSKRRRALANLPTRLPSITSTHFARRKECAFCSLCPRQKSTGFGLPVNFEEHRLSLCPRRQAQVRCRSPLCRGKESSKIRNHKLIGAGARDSDREPRCIVQTPQARMPIANRQGLIGQLELVLQL